ncbi:hypothetical protein [Nostoc sp. UHCC 0302]|uniref:hypothetical protein n=1 Tax=Nostoc sp. UHCC 0302 TaxID=3134896 RepID=UPI00311C8C47
MYAPTISSLLQARPIGITQEILKPDFLGIYQAYRKAISHRNRVFYESRQYEGRINLPSIGCAECHFQLNIFS